jgi:hypothetical protein
LPEKHRILTYGLLTTDVEGSQTAQTTSTAKSTLQQRFEDAQQRPSQLTVDRVLFALVQWTVLAYHASNCVKL